MTKPLVEALNLRPLPHPPVWIMRQAGRYLPEYRAIRKKHSFQEVVATPELAAEVTIQPIRRFGMDGAVIFADIMTPLEAMGVELTFDPGPKLAPLTLAEVAALPPLEPRRVAHVAETIRLVSKEIPDTTAVIGFAGAPVTLLAYLLEGGGSKDFMAMRAVLRSDPDLATRALEGLARSMNTYLRVQAEAGADVVQLFDTWAGLLDRNSFAASALPAASTALADVGCPTIYFAPGAGHTLDLQEGIGSTGIGIDWRTSLQEAFALFPDRAIQGNLDPAVLQTDHEAIRGQVKRMLRELGGRPGHIVNLGHGIDRRTRPENVAALVEAVRS
ncbi:MAG: uroporphyrinogen decarboxylase [Actinobacteria bacterium]|nr:MAG: uroporphyrinogen decarboxylase [Actinomycetota bacterium]REK35763.1 MAG: uroporphyrinogen decarboxylase [Actinomycetota bacterium]